MTKTIDITSDTLVRDLTGDSAVAYAMAALQRDLHARLGLYRGEPTRIIDLKLDASAGSFDAYTIEAEPAGIIITGSDVLGLIHGIYDFAEEHLGADPMQWVTRKIPAWVESVEIPLGKTKSRPRTVKHRGFFFNDEDLLVGFQMEKVEDGFSMEVWQKLFETLLRLGGTFVIPGTNIFSDEKQIALASEMGLHIGQHHAEPVGCPTYHCWPRQLPYSLTRHEDVFVTNWRRAIERQAGENVIWTLGFRGFLDGAFWKDDPSLGAEATDAEKAAIINRAVELQADLVRELRPEQAHEFVFYCRNEMFPLLEQGLLKLPEGTTLLFTPGQEDWEGRNDFPLRGYYVWANFFNRRADMRILRRTPEEIGRDTGKFIESGATEMMVLNVGCLREKGFHIRQYMNLAKDYPGWKDRAGGEAWYREYVSTLLGVESPELESVYRTIPDCFMNRRLWRRRKKCFTWKACLRISPVPP